MYLPVPVPRLHAVVLHLLPLHLKITHHQRVKRPVSLIMTLTLVYRMLRNLALQKTALVTFLWVVLSVSWVLLPSCFPGFLHFPESVSRCSIDFFAFFTFSFFLLETHYHLHIARLTQSSLTPVQEYHCCPNDCILFRGPQVKETRCPVCGSEWFISGKTPRKRFKYLPLASHI